VKRKKETRYGRRDRGDEEPLRPAIEAVVSEQSEQNDEAGKNRDQANQRVNNGVDVQYHFITPSFAIVNR